MYYNKLGYNTVVFIYSIGGDSYVDFVSIFYVK